MPRPVPLEHQIAELERELKVRSRVYPRWMQTNKIKPETASDQVERMEAARDTLLALRAERARQSLHLDAAGMPKLEPTVLERAAVDALNEVKAWLDSDRAAPPPVSTRMKVDGVLMLFEQRRIQQPAG